MEVKLASLAPETAKFNVPQAMFTSFDASFANFGFALSLKITSASTVTFGGPVRILAIGVSCPSLFTYSRGISRVN